jgi:predicted pyridoxine 5'-phosphate oxidase superfamily flavin-nucleotide-binding protein
MGVLTDEMKQVVEQQRLGFVATLCADGTPNLSPKGTVCVLDDDHLMFADIRSPGTVANLRVNPSVEVNVVDPFVRKGYRFKGSAEVLEAGADFERLLALFVTAGVFDAPKRIRAIVVMRIEQARPLISPGYDRGMDEVSVRAQWVRYYVGAHEPHDL